jgi:hypothetical protein
MLSMKGISITPWRDPVPHVFFLPLFPAPETKKKMAVVRVLAAAGLGFLLTDGLRRRI